MLKLPDKIRDLFSRTKRMPELTTSVVEHDKLDDGVLDDMVDRALHFRRALYDKPNIDPDELPNAEQLTDEQRERFTGDYDPWSDLFSDTFRALHTLDQPALRQPEEIKPSRELNRRILQQVLDTEEFQELRPDTRHDEIASAFTAISLSGGLRDLIEGELSELVAQSAQMEQSEQDAENAQQQLDDLREQVRDQGGQATDEQKQQIQEQVQVKTDARTELAQQQAQQQAQPIPQGVTEAVQEAVEEGQNAASAISSLPGTEPGSGVKLTPDQMIELAQEWRSNPEMFEMAKMMGRMQRDLRYRRTNRIVGGREEIVDVKLGNNLPLILPHEKVKLRHPLLRRDFIRRFYERSILEYETQGYAEAGRGPIVVLVDGSGSMGGMPNIWARSVALSLVSIARREKRDAAIVEYASSSQQRAWEFIAKAPMDPAKVISFASHMYNGGTDATPALAIAKQIIETKPAFKSADIVLITDGHDNYGDEDRELQASLREQGVRIHGVAIGMKAEQNTFLQQMCESTVSAYDLAGSNDATDHLAEVIS